MGIIVLVVGPRAGHSHRFSSLLEILDERPVEPLAAIIEIKAQDPKREPFLHISGLFEHALGPFVPDGSTFRPGAGQIGVGETPNEVTRQTTAAVSHTVGFQKTHAPLIPNL